MFYYGDINKNALIMTKISKIIFVGWIAFQFALVSCSSSNKINCPSLALEQMAKGNKEGAIDAFTCAINENPDDYLNAGFHIQRGILRNEVGNKYGAIDDFNVGIDKQIVLIDRQLEDEKKGIAKSNDGSWRMKKELGSTYYRRAIVKSDLGDKSGTINDFQSAAQIYSSIGDTEWYQKSLQAVEIAKNR